MSKSSKRLKTFCRDNADGGNNGPETVTFLHPQINQHYTYLIAIDDFEWVNNGQDFFASGSAIQVRYLFIYNFKVSIPHHKVSTNAKSC